jgi:hypothetical protein
MSVPRDNHRRSTGIIRCDKRPMPTQRLRMVKLSLIDTFNLSHVFGALFTAYSL